MRQGGQGYLAHAARAEVGGQGDEQDDLQYPFGADEVTKRRWPLVLGRWLLGAGAWYACLDLVRRGRRGAANVRRSPLAGPHSSQGRRRDDKRCGVDEKGAGWAGQGDQTAADRRPDKSGQLGAGFGDCVAGLEICIGQQRGDDRERAGKEQPFPGADHRGDR